MQEKNMGHICPIGRSGVKLNNNNDKLASQFETKVELD